MEETNTSQDQDYNYSNITSGYYDYSDISSGYYNYSDISSEYQDQEQKLDLFLDVMTWIITCIGLPLILVAIYFLYSEVRNDHVAPIYVINLLITDLVQLCCMIVFVAPNVNSIISFISEYLYYYCLAASVGFMVCVALERYLVITCPLWYRFRKTIKFSVLICVVVWVLPLFDLLCYWFWKDSEAIQIIWGIFLLLPLPLLIFFLGGSLKALSTSRVSSDEKRRILGVLVLVLLIYTLLFLPRIINFLTDKLNYTFWILSLVLIQLSPLADLVLYVFMRKGTTDKLLATVCCCRMDSNDTSISTASGFEL